MLQKTHHDLLERDCHSLDKCIAEALAAGTDESYDNITAFGQYVNQLQSIKKDEKELHKAETKMSEVLDRISIEGTSSKLTKLQEITQWSINDLYDSIEEKKTEFEHQDLPFLSGPVTSNLDSVLKQNKITVQAYHGRSFVGNHCHKYLQTAVLHNICQSVVHKTFQCTDSNELHNKAHDLADKFQTLNELYAAVHRRISHARAIKETDISELQKDIRKYMQFYRSEFGDTRIIPKQHILECHCTDFVQNWQFGLGFLGEQGGEETHAFVNELKVRVRGINDPAQKIQVLMKEQLTIVSPRIKASMPGCGRRKQGKHDD